MTGRPVAFFALSCLVACTSSSEPGMRTAALDTERRGVWVATARGAVTLSDHARLVHQAAEGRVLLVSGRPPSGIWAWTSNGFELVAEPFSPFYRQGATYDSTRDAVVIFGGQEQDDTLADTSDSTWVLDAAGLRAVATTGPTARGGAALAYDAARDRVVLVGGTNQLSGAALSDTWLFDGTTWTEATPPTPAPAVTGAGLAYDATRELVFMARPVWGADGETWQWDGTTWAQVDTAIALPDSYTYALTWDPDRGRVLGLAAGQLWQLEGTSWSRIGAGGPDDAARANGSIAYDATRHRVVLYEGGGIVWEHDGAEWIAVSQPAPTARHSAATAYDADRSRIVLTGGYENEYVRDTWEWDGSAWIRGPEGPAGAYDVDLAFDAARHRVMTVVGGRSWGYDGERWTDLGAADGVVPTMMAYDGARSEMVAHSGDQTWTYDGSTWTAVATTPPTSVRDSDAAYDARRERIVRFGGYTDGSGDSEIADTWEWDGTSWTLATPGASPSPRGGHAMAYDSERGVVVLFGGYDHRETWEYDGATWIQRVTPSAPDGSWGNGMVYDSARRRTAFYASDGRIWEYFPVGDACTDDAECASGHCIDSVCCDHACPSPCWVCSTAAGGSTDGLCQTVADAGTDCEVPDGGALPWEDAGGAGDGDGDGSGGCCRVAGAPGGPSATLVLVGLALVLLRRPR